MIEDSKHLPISNKNSIILQLKIYLEVRMIICRIKIYNKREIIYEN